MKKLTLIISFLFVFGCQNAVSGDKVMEEKESNTFQGTVQYFAMEGGFYGIVTNKGEKFLPQNLSPEHQQDGAVIEFSGEVQNVMTFQQWGKPFKISKIKLLKPGNKHKNPTH